MRILSAVAGIALLGSIGMAGGCGTADSGPPMETKNPPGMTGGPGTGNTDYPMAKPGFALGDQVANLSFLAKLHGSQDAGKDPVKVTLADFYALGKQGAKLLFLSGAAEWCGPCNQEAEGLEKALSDPGFLDYQKMYRKEGDTADPIQIVQVVFQNLDGSQSDRDTIDRWIKAHNIGFQIGIDPKSEVSQYIPANTIPQSLYIKLSDMTLLSRENGYGTANGNPDDSRNALIANLERSLTTAAK